MICQYGNIGGRGMINFLPQIYENELLYSVIARYQRMCGIVSRRALMEDLYGRYFYYYSSLFPKNIQTFVDNLPITSKITVDEIIQNHTMFSFYTAFLSEEKTNTVYQHMVNESVKSKATPEQLIGLGGSKVKLPEYLRYCPVCFKEDLEHLGESYWRTNHQIVGAYYCSKHGVLLKSSKVLKRDDNAEFICADEDVCNEVKDSDPYPNQIKELNLQYIRNAELLLNQRLPRKDLDYIISFYIDRLREKGLASTNGSLYIKEIQEQFLRIFPEQYLEMMQSSINPEKSSNWLRLFVRNNGKNRSPLRHLLFMQFLEIEVNDLFFSDNVKGKIPVLNQNTPKFDINERRSQWLQLIKDNPNANRSQLKEIGKGLHTWIFKHDREWYEKVTPRKKRKKKTGIIDWERRDKECLEMAKKAVEVILNKKGKPIRVCPSNIRRVLGVGVWFNNKKLMNTNNYMREIREDTNSFRIRKIRWAIEEMIEKEEELTPYKIQLYAGFGGNNKEVRELILKVLEEGSY